MMLQPKDIISLEECQERFKEFGECDHFYKKWIVPYKCNTKVDTCIVCAKTFEEKRYFTQADMIADEIELLLDSGINVKEEIYTKVVISLNVPRPTVRRVASGLRSKMIEQANILGGISDE